MPSIGGVTFYMDADTVRLQREMLKAQRQTQTTVQKMQRGFSRAFRRIKQTVGTLGVALAGVFSAQMIRQQLAYAGNLQRVAETVGFTAEQVQELRFASEQLNISQSTVDMALQRFSRRMGEAAQNTGEALKVTKQYGIQVKDSAGGVRDNIDILKQWADVISNIEDEQEQLRVSMKLFDSEGAVLVRLLRQGADGMDEFFKKARELGIALDEELVANAAEADRVFNEIKQTISADLARAVAENADALETFGRGIGFVAREAIQAVTALTTFFDAIDTTTRAGIEAEIARIEGKIAKASENFNKFSGKIGRDWIAQNAANQIVEFNKDLDELNLALARLDQRSSEATFGEEVKQEAQKIREAGELIQGFTIEGPRDRILRPEIKEDIEELAMDTEFWDEQLQKAKDSVKEVNDAGRQLGFTFESAFESAILEGEKLSDVFKSMLKDIGRIILRLGVTEHLSDFIGGLFSGGIDGTAATGGRIGAGQTFLVGEQGPELFTPSSSGFITPNSALAGVGGSSISYNIDARGVDEQRIMQRMIPLLEQTVETTRSLVRRDKLEGAL